MKSNLKTVVIEHEGKQLLADVFSEYRQDGKDYLLLHVTDQEEAIHQPLSQVIKVVETSKSEDEKMFNSKVEMFQQAISELTGIGGNPLADLTEEPEQERAIKKEEPLNLRPYEDEEVKMVEEADWEKAEAHLMATKKKYEEARQGQFGLEKKIMPLVKRLENEERSPELYEAIMKL